MQPRFKSTPPPNNPRMGFNSQQQQMAPNWHQTTENGVPQSFQPYQDMGMTQVMYEGNQYYAPSPPANAIYNSSLEMNVNATAVHSVPLTKEPRGRTGITICCRCSFQNYLCASELATCDEKIAALQQENDELKLKAKAYEEKIKEMERIIQELTEKRSFKTATTSLKALSPDAIEFSPKKQEDVPIVSVKEITDEPQGADTQVADKEKSTYKTKVIPPVDKSSVRKPEVSATSTKMISSGQSWDVEQVCQEGQELEKPKAREVPVQLQGDAWNDEWTPQPELNPKEDNNSHSKYLGNEHNQKRRGSGQENNFGRDGRGKNIKKNDGDQQYSHRKNSEGSSKSYNKKTEGKDFKGKDKKHFKGYESGASNDDSKNSAGSWRNEERSKNSNRDDSSQQNVKNHWESSRGGNHYDNRPHGDGNKYKRHNLNENRPHSDDSKSKRHNYHDKAHGQLQLSDIKGSSSKGQPVNNIVKEVDGDLFSAPSDFSLGHCVAQDFRMGSGIAVRFKQEFKGTGELLDQHVPVGGCAYLKDSKNDRYIFYLVTKHVSNGKPTYDSLHKSLEELHDKCQKFGVKKLAIPRIGCGLDRLDWDKVKNYINGVFQDAGMEIVAYNFNVEGLPEAEGKRPTGAGGPYVVYKVMKLLDIDPSTALLFLGTEDGHMDTTARSLDEKFHFGQEYKKVEKTSGKVWVWKKNKDYYIYSLIVSKTFMVNNFSFTNLEACCKELSKLLRQDKSQYVGLEYLKDWHNSDATFTEKVVTMLRHSLPRSVYELWVCYRDLKDDYYDMCQKYASKQSQY